MKGFAQSNKFFKKLAANEYLNEKSAYGRLGWARQVMLGFVPQPNLQKLTIYQDMISIDETQQIKRMGFRSSVIKKISYNESGVFFKANISIG